MLTNQRNVKERAGSGFDRVNLQRCHIDIGEARACFFGVTAPLSHANRALSKRRVIDFQDRRGGVATQTRI